MDSGTLIVAAVFIAICILPFLLTGRKYRKHKKHLLMALHQLAEQQNNKITTHEIKGNFGIALDEGAGNLFFARYFGTEMTTRSIHLSDYGMCKHHNAIRVTEDGEKVTIRVELEFIPVSDTGKNVVLDLYNEEYDNLVLAGELQVAIQWEQLVKEFLSRTNYKPVHVKSKKKVA